MKIFEAKSIIKFICYSLIIFLLISIVAIVIATCFQLKEINTRNTKITENEKSIIDLEEKITSKNINILLSDMRYLEYTFQSYNNDYEGGYEHLEENWKAFLDSKNIYYKIRFIDTSGEEKIRINYMQEGSYVSKIEKLQNKQDRYYFQNTIGLKKAQIYVSKLDLNIENGEIQLPIQPIIRFSMAVFGKDGGLKGIIVLSYNANFLLEDYKDSSLASHGNVYLLNADGYWLLNDKRKDKEWAFMYEDKESVSFTNEFPDEWESMNKNSSGTIITNNGLFAYKSIAPYSVFDGSAGNQLIVPGEDKWWIVSFVPSDFENGVLPNNKLYEITLYTIRTQIPTLLIVLIISMAFSVLIIAYQRANTKMRRFSFDTLTGVYNRRAGFELLEKSYKKAMRSGKKSCVCFIDVNGLKDVNDAFGHVVGDELISCVTNAIKKFIKEPNFVIRIGGDEFLIVFVNENSKKAEEIWQQINLEYQRINESENKQFVISVSHGIEEFRFDLNEFIDDIINLADEKMYNEKRNLSAHLRTSHRIIVPNTHLEKEKND